MSRWTWILRLGGHDENFLCTRGCLTGACSSLTLLSADDDTRRHESSTGDLFGLGMYPRRHDYGALGLF